MAFKQRKGLRNAVLAAALGVFLAGGIKTGAEQITLGKKTEPFSLETTLAIDNIGEVNDLGQANPNVNLNIYGEYVSEEGYKVLGEFEMENISPRKAVLAAGHRNAYLGVKWENLSDETTLLEGANLFKLEFGIRDIANFLNLSSFVAYTSVPNMEIIEIAEDSVTGRDKTYYYKTPFQLYTSGIDGILKPKFKLKNNSEISPWVSGKILINGTLAQDTEYIPRSGYDDSSFAWAFNHFNVGLGVDFSSKNLDLGLENYWEGNYNPLLTGTKHKAKINLHDKDRRNFLEYALTANPQFNWLYWPTKWDLQSDVNFKLNFLKSLYLKGSTNINHTTTENLNLIAALGYSKEGVNIEAFFNLQNKAFGITLSNRDLGNKLERYTKEPFVEISYSDADVYTPDPLNIHTTLPQRVEAIQLKWGPNITDVVSKIRSESTDYISAMQKISEYASYFEWKDSDNGMPTAEQVHDNGRDDCLGLNGVLFPTVINGVLGSKGYKSWGKGFMGPYIGHALTIIKKPNGKYDVMNYDDIHFLDAKTEQEAIDKVYPGAHTIDGGIYSETSQRVINVLEESVWK